LGEKVAGGTLATAMKLQVIIPHKTGNCNRNGFKMALGIFTFKLYII